MVLKSIIFLCLFLPSILSSQIEICDNGIDDDADGRIDLNDREDCECMIIEPVSLIPNPSFEDMNCCPDRRSELNCASMWIQASAPTTDYIHNCGWLGWEDFPPPQPFPDGDGIMGFRDGRVRNSTNDFEPFWKEYAGACLINPLRVGSSYRFQFEVGFVSREKSPAIDISFFGTTDCDNLPFGVGIDDFGCPTNSPDWVKLAETRVSGGNGNTWVTAVLDITPTEDIYAIAIGPDCDPVSSPISIYYFFDNLLLADFESFELQISETQHPCSEDYTLAIPFHENFEYQWYQDGIALVGETFSELSQNYGNGSYEVRILDGLSCRVSAAFDYQIPIFEVPISVSICEEDFYQFGDIQLSEPGFYIDTFKTENNCDSIVSLNLDVIGFTFDTLDVSVFQGQSFDIGGERFNREDIYSLTFTSSLGCDSLVLLKLSNFDIYLPNIFSPNGNGLNEEFMPFAGADEIQSYNMLIFDRWGNELFEGLSWDGKNAQPGVYFYTITFEFVFGEPKTISGDVTLIR